MAKLWRRFLCSIWVAYCNGRCAIQTVDKSVTQVSEAMKAKRKAFDCVQHYILLKKLKYSSIHNEELQMFRSYLTDRKQIVTVKENLSQVIVIKHGVQQNLNEVKHKT